MAAPPEDKGLLTQKLEQDRQEMVVQGDELKEHYNPVPKIAASIRKDPLGWIIAAALVSVLLSRLFGRPKEVLLSTESVDRTRAQELPRITSDEDESSETKKLLSVAKWAIGAYLIREFDRCLVQPFRYVADRSGRLISLGTKHEDIFETCKTGSRNRVGRCLLCRAASTRPHYSPTHYGNSLGN